MKSRTKIYGVAIVLAAGWLRGAPTVRAEGRLLELPVEYDEGRFIAAPHLQFDEKLRLILNTAGGTFLFDDSVKRLELKTTSSGEDGKLRAKLPAMKLHYWIPGVRQYDGAIEVVPKDNFSRIASMGNNLDGMLGQAWYGDKVFVADYPGRSLFVANGTDTIPAPHGAKLWQMGFLKDDQGRRAINFPRVTITVDGKEHDMLLETGATVFLTDSARREAGGKLPARGAASFIAQSVFDEWRKAHPDWKGVNSADSETELPMIRVPKVGIAGIEVGPVWFVARPTENYHEFTSQWTDKRVDGSLGGNALESFKLTMDFRKGVIWVEKPGD